MVRSDRLDPDKIAGSLKTKRIGRRVVVHNRTSSTSDIAAEYARNPDNDGLVVFAEEQTAGRGRTGATWYSGHGESLLFSVLLIDCELSNELLSLTCAVGVAGAVGEVGGHTTRIKWPNDIILADRKIGGILVEFRGERAEGRGQKTRDKNVGTGARRGTTVPPSVLGPPSSGVHIIGIGLNCHQTTAAFPPEIRGSATSLDLVSRTRCDRVTLARRVLASLDHWLTVAARDKQPIIDCWSQLSTQLGQRVTVSCDGRQSTGNCIGVDPEKGLILQLDRGGVRMFDAAHTTIVK
ncbi:MAG: biotin--[acetyl-CoA-carboxylase] ligase [Phycisphaerales bacterium]|nr:MAG: biotin--[acetyl-CoA-carboxylase] ligase [Phycisphaerales bacterium]